MGRRPRGRPRPNFVYDMRRSYQQLKETAKDKHTHTHT